MISLAKIYRFPAVFFNTLGQNVVKAHKRYVRQLKKSHTGRRFPAYAKAKKGQVSYAKRKAAGKAAPNQISRSATPDLTLTGKMLDSLRLIVAEPNGFRYGITDPKEAAKLLANQAGIFGNTKKPSKKRIISSEKHAVPPEIREMIMEEMSKQVVRQITRELKQSGMGYKVISI
tara:strand:- start:619 stop:1140 length:522 start_codon:yes stop_codon:yes gene_type:complete